MFDHPQIRMGFLSLALRLFIQTFWVWFHSCIGMAHSFVLSIQVEICLALAFKIQVIIRSYFCYGSPSSWSSFAMALLQERISLVQKLSHSLCLNNCPLPYYPLLALSTTLTYSSIFLKCLLKIPMTSLKLSLLCLPMQLCLCSTALIRSFLGISRNFSTTSQVPRPPDSSMFTLSALTRQSLCISKSRSLFLYSDRVTFARLGIFSTNMI